MSDVFLFCFSVAETNQYEVHSKEEKYETFEDFEKRCEDIHHNRCFVCHRVSIGMVMHTKTTCARCYGKSKDTSRYIANDCLPVWYKTKEDRLARINPQFQIPNCLSKLRLGEKMLLQLAKLFVPLVHIKNGTMGIRGHVCAFPQNISDVADTLPRLPEDVTIVRVIQKIQAEVGGKELVDKQFFVRKQSVLDALEWLVEHNDEYRHVKIAVENLDWIEGEEAEIKTLVREVETMDTQDEYDDNDDKGPAPDQTFLDGVHDHVTNIGMIVEDRQPIISDENTVIQAVLKNAMKEAGTKSTMEWPTIGVDAVDEYDRSKKIFCMAFPWLFPGGIGDVHDYIDSNISNWGQHMLFYEDGRFAADELFCFFAENYIVRHTNAKSGGFFVNKQNADTPESLEILKEKIKEGDSGFINHLTYWTQNVPGSDGYWRNEKSKLYSWISHHVQQGNGMPMFFITLSCAEYHWPDINRLLKERLDLAEKDNSDVDRDNPGYCAMVNRYAVVIQEYFQARVETWLKSAGKKLFGIKHYWIRYEFAPGRGQIHAHLLAISEDLGIFDQMEADKKREDAIELWPARLATYAKDRLGFTAEVSEGFDELDAMKENPVRIRFTDLKRDSESIQRDEELLKKRCMFHKCNGFCLRAGRGANNHCRECRSGAGTETIPNSCETTGFDLRTHPYVGYDKKNTLRLYMPRNHKRVVQTSADLLHMWRGNCDVQILIYKNSSKTHFDPEDIARVTDYVVGYSCKGAKTLKEEHNQNRSFILK